MTQKKRIGILTSGGDCAGLNATIRAVTRHATNTYGWKVIGICRATMGLMSRPALIKNLEVDEMDRLWTTGGTLLGTTNKGDPFAFPMPDGTLKDRSDEIIEGYHNLNLDALIGVGGDGSLAILRKIAQKGNINFVGIPKTIDNDVSVTENSIGFDTAVNIATEAIERLHFTAASHNRVMIVEVMGRDAGHIAINAGIAGGSHVILIPEIPYNIQKVCNFIKCRQTNGLDYTIITVSEAAISQEQTAPMTTDQSFGECRYGGIGQELANQICHYTNAETRVTVLGHTQRGGVSSPVDRILASTFGVAAVDLIAQDTYDRMVAWKDRQVISVPIEEAIATYRTVDLDGTIVKTARGLGICLGD